MHLSWICMHSKPTVYFDLDFYVFCMFGGIVEIGVGAQSTAPSHLWCCHWILASYFTCLNSHLFPVMCLLSIQDQELNRSLLIVQTTKVWLPIGSFPWNSNTLLSERSHCRLTWNTSIPQGEHSRGTEILCQPEIWRLNFSREMQPATQANKIINQAIQTIKYLFVKFTLWCR